MFIQGNFSSMKKAPLQQYSRVSARGPITAMSNGHYSPKFNIRCKIFSISNLAPIAVTIKTALRNVVRPPRLQIHFKLRIMTVPKFLPQKFMCLTLKFSEIVAFAKPQGVLRFELAFSIFYFGALHKCARSQKFSKSQFTGSILSLASFILLPLK